MNRRKMFLAAVTAAAVPAIGVPTAPADPLLAGFKALAAMSVEDWARVSSTWLNTFGTNDPAVIERVRSMIEEGASLDEIRTFAWEQGAYLRADLRAARQREVRARKGVSA